MKPSVCVLLCTYNGEKYLKEQLDSVFAQKDVDVTILAHDDGSSDGTLEMLKEYGINVIGDEHYGPAHGFMYLMQNAPDFEYYAFCDQDDVWDVDKLSIAVSSMNNKEKPALWCCSTRLVDKTGKHIQDHILDEKRTLKARLFHAGISGNTMVFNRQLKDLTIKHVPENMIMHDSWMVKLCIAIGGEFVIDQTPHISYRMHSDNSIGMELNFKQKLQKFIGIVNWKEPQKEFEDICKLYKNDLTIESQKLGEIIKRAETGGLRERIEFFKAENIRFNNTGFKLAFIIGVLKGNLK